VAFIALVIFQARWIIRARFPGLRAVEALATSLPLFLLLFPALTSSWRRLRPATSARN
jgi:voltage-gated potassium channel